MFNSHCCHFFTLAVIFPQVALHIVGGIVHTSHITLCAMSSVQKYQVATASQLGELPATRQFRDLECSASITEDDSPLLPRHLSLLKRRQEKRRNQRLGTLSDPSALPVDPLPVEIPRALVLSPERCGRGDIRPVFQDESPDSWCSRLARHQAYLRRSNVQLMQKLSQLRFAVQEMEISPTCETCRVTPTGSTPPRQHMQYTAAEEAKHEIGEELIQAACSKHQPPSCPRALTLTTQEDHLLNAHSSLLTRRPSFNTTLYTASNHFYLPLIPSTSRTSLLPPFPLPPNHSSIPTLTTPDPKTVFERVALAGRGRGNPIRFHTSCFATGTKALSVGTCTFVSLPYASNGCFRLETVTPNSYGVERVRFILNFIAEVVGAERRGVWWLISRIDITSTILELAKAKIARRAAPGRGLLDEVDWNDLVDSVSSVPSSALRKPEEVDAQMEEEVSHVSPETYAFSVFLDSVKRPLQSFFVLCPAGSNSAPYRLDAKIDIPELAGYVVAYASRSIAETGLEGSGFDDDNGAFAEAVQDRRMCRVRMTVEKGHEERERRVWFVPLGDGKEIWWICFLVGESEE